MACYFSTLTLVATCTMALTASPKACSCRALTPGHHFGCCWIFTAIRPSSSFSTVVHNWTITELPEGTCLCRKLIYYILYMEEWIGSHKISIEIVRHGLWCIVLKKCYYFFRKIIYATLLLNKLVNCRDGSDVIRFLLSSILVWLVVFIRDTL